MSTNRAARRDNVPAARELRTRQTSAEVLLWEALRNRRLAGLKFRRQHPVGPFVIDFCCPEYRLAIELDGPVHDTQQDRDAEREALLVTAGYRVVRFANEAVVNDSLLSSKLSKPQRETLYVHHSTFPAPPAGNATESPSPCAQGRVPFGWRLG